MSASNDIEEQLLGRAALVQRTADALAELGWSEEQAASAIAALVEGEASPWPTATFVLPLRKPIEVAGVTYGELKLREPTDDEWTDIFAQPPEKRRRYAVARVTGLPSDQLGRVGIGDLVRAERYLSAFFDVGQAIGGW